MNASNYVRIARNFTSFFITHKSKIERQQLEAFGSTIPGKSIWDSRLHHASFVPPNQCWKMSRFFATKRKQNHMIINTISGRRGERASCPNLFFVWDCSLMIYSSRKSAIAQWQVAPLLRKATSLLKSLEVVLEKVVPPDWFIRLSLLSASLKV